MRRTTATLLLLLVLEPAFAGERGPVCREESVVDEITREVRASNYYGNVDPRLVTEQPTSDPLVVRCQVCVLSEPYDTIRFGDKSVGRCESRDFEVQILSGGLGGFVVRAVR
jgi:hypothetical protein